MKNIFHAAILLAVLWIIVVGGGCSTKAGTDLANKEDMMEREIDFEYEQAVKSNDIEARRRIIIKFMKQKFGIDYEDLQLLLENASH